jgi:hypothetical protein
MLEILSWLINKFCNFIELIWNKIKLFSYILKEKYYRFRNK